MASEPPCRVLIADADPVLRQQIGKRLLEADIFSDSVADARSAIEKLREFEYALVLLDISLPQVGVEPILEFLGRVPGSRRPVILVLATGNASRSLDVDLVQIVLRKPCNLRQLSDLVGSCARAAAAGAALLPPGGDNARLPVM